MPRQGAEIRRCRLEMFSGARSNCASMALATQPRKAQAAPFDGFHGQQRMIQAAQAQADDQDHVHLPARCQVREAAAGVERREPSAGALDDQDLGAQPQPIMRTVQHVEVDLDPRFLGRDMRRDGRRKGDKGSLPNRWRARSWPPTRRLHRHCAGPRASAYTPRPPASSRPRACRGRPRRGTRRLQPGFCPLRCRCR